MKTRKFLALALALIMAFAMIPVASLAENVDGLVNEAAAMRKLDNAWAALDAAEADALAQGMSRTEVINAVYNAALNLNTVDKDSFSDFTKDGFYFTVDGMYCAYNYRLRNELGKVTEPANDGIFTIKGSGSNAAMKDASPPTFCFSDRTTVMTPTLTIPTRTQLSPLRTQPAAIGNSSRVTLQPAPQSLKHSPITAPFLLTATAPQAVLPPISASPPTKASLRKTTTTVGQSAPAAQHGSTAATFSIISTVRISATRSYGSASAKA